MFKSNNTINDCKKIIILNIIIQMGLFVKYRNNLIAKLTGTKLTEANENNLEKVGKDKNDEEVKSEFNISDYNMVKFLVYDKFNFNSKSMYNTFKNKYFNITYLNYSFSNEFKKVKFEFDFGIYDKNKKLIHPSDFALYNDITLLCYMTVEKNIIYSLPQILENKYFGCIEFCNFDEKVQFGLYMFHQWRRSYFTITFNFYQYINLNDNKHEIMIYSLNLCYIGNIMK